MGVGMKTINVNCQLKKIPKRSPKPNNAKDSHMIPNLVPVICWMANAPEERRAQIAPELFSG
jgi:hypothetical protein